MNDAVKKLILSGMETVRSEVLRTYELAVELQSIENVVSLEHDHAGVTSAQLVDILTTIFNHNAETMMGLIGDRISNVPKDKVLGGSMEGLGDVKESMVIAILHSFVKTVVEDLTPSTIGTNTMAVFIANMEVQMDRNPRFGGDGGTCGDPSCKACRLKDTLRGSDKGGLPDILTNMMEDAVREQLTRDVNELEGDEKTEAVKKLIDFNQMVSRRKEDLANSTHH